MTNTTVTEPASEPVAYLQTDTASESLTASYHSILNNDWIPWSAQYRKVRILGRGGQGIVYLSERQGSDLFRVPVALKVFSPESYRDAAGYVLDMSHVAEIASRVALIQHDNLIDLHNFIEQGGVRIMIMEWIDGYDLRDLLTVRVYEGTRTRLGADRWLHFSNVIMTPGPYQPRFKPGVAIQILRECLAGLAALHREGIVHGDLKPANIMVKRTGNAKIIDIGSATDLDHAAGRRLWSPAYAAPEVLQGSPNTIRSDIASLGYILIEMLAGQSPFEGCDNRDALIQAKKTLDKRLKDLLPVDVACNEILIHLIQKMIAPDPARRFPSAQAADLDRKGAADFHRQLIKGDLASEYEHDIRIWLEDLA